MSAAARKPVTQAHLETGDRERYLLALTTYLDGVGESALGAAYELGRAAVTEGKGILEFVAMHQAALQKLFSDPHRTGDAARVLCGAEEFLAEGLSPYEMTHRGFKEAIVSLRHLNETLQQEIQRIARAVHELRRLSHELRPTVLDDPGLAPAILFLADGFSKRTGLTIPVTTGLQDRLPKKIETAVYRIVQEALTNVARHSGARCVKIQLERVGRTLHCVIADDGTGFDVPAVLTSQPRKGLGLLGMQERLNAIGGTLRVSSALGKGTELLIQLPLEE